MHINFGFLPGALVGEGCWARRRLLRRDDRAAPRGAGADRRVRPAARRAGRRPPDRARRCARSGSPRCCRPISSRTACREPSLREPVAARAALGAHRAGDGARRLRRLGPGASGRDRRAGRGGAGRIWLDAVRLLCWFRCVLRWASARAIARCAGPAAAPGCGCCRCAMLCPLPCFVGSFCGRNGLVAGPGCSGSSRAAA